MPTLGDQIEVDGVLAYWWNAKPVRSKRDIFVVEANLAFALVAASG